MTVLAAQPPCCQGADECCGLLLVLRRLQDQGQLERRHQGPHRPCRALAGCYCCCGTWLAALLLVLLDSQASVLPLQYAEGPLESHVTRRAAAILLCRCAHTANSNNCARPAPRTTSCKQGLQVTAACMPAYPEGRHAHAQGRATDGAPQCRPLPSSHACSAGLSSLCLSSVCCGCCFAARHGFGKHGPWGACHHGRGHCLQRPVVCLILSAAISCCSCGWQRKLGRRRRQAHRAASCRQLLGSHGGRHRGCAGQAARGGGPTVAQRRTPAGLLGRKGPFCHQP